MFITIKLQTFSPKLWETFLTNFSIFFASICANMHRITRLNYFYLSKCAPRIRGDWGLEKAKMEIDKHQIDKSTAIPIMHCPSLLVNLTQSARERKNNWKCSNFSINFAKALAKPFRLYNNNKWNAITNAWWLLLPLLSFFCCLCLWGRCGCEHTSNDINLSFTWPLSNHWICCHLQ